MSDNMEVWNKLGKTAPEHTKKFQRVGGFKGTAIKPIYTIQKMTEVFGPAGGKWGTDAPRFTTVQGNDGQVAVYCDVGLWTKDDSGNIGYIYGVGGDMVVVKQSSGLRTDDEAFKKAYTDALGNAMKHLGMSADVHMGLFDDSKYVQEREREERAQEAPSDPVQPSSGPLKSSAQAKRDNDWPELKTEVDACLTLEALNLLAASPAFVKEARKMPRAWQQQLSDYIQTCRDEFAANPPQADDPFGLDRLELTQAQKIAGTP